MNSKFIIEMHGKKTTITNIKVIFICSCFNPKLKQCSEKCVLLKMFV